MRSKFFSYRVIFLLPSLFPHAMPSFVNNSFSSWISLRASSSINEVFRKVHATSIMPAMVVLPQCDVLEDLTSWFRFFVPKPSSLPFHFGLGASNFFLSVYFMFFIFALIYLLSLKTFIKVFGLELLEARSQPSSTSISTSSSFSFPAWF